MEVDQRRIIIQALGLDGRLIRDHAVPAFVNLAPDRLREDLHGGDRDVLPADLAEALQENL
jgi:hypothetical protein